MEESAEPAPAVLGSTLLSAAIAHAKQKPAPASSGCSAVDASALDGGIRYGEITSIAGASAMGKSLVALHAIANHLLAHEDGEVAFIDTTGSFSPLRLRDVIAFRLGEISQQSRFHQTGYVYTKVQSNAEAVAKTLLLDKAIKILDRAKVMRVFDFAGVVEAVGEVGEQWERYERSINVIEIPAPRGLSESHAEIADSDEEIDERSDAEPSNPVLDETNSASREPSNLQLHTKPGRIGMIVIDNVANVVGSMISISSVQGHALLTTFMRSLRHLTSRHHICTLLINVAVGMNNSGNLGYARRAEDNVSIFASTSGKPALGRTYACLIDTSVFMSSIPETKDDAEVAFGGDGRDTSNWRNVAVLEVLKDRNGTQEGRWAAFQLINGIELKSWI